MCEHVYKSVRAFTCPFCNKPTHETDWKEIARLHKEWIASGKVVQQGWWSI